MTTIQRLTDSCLLVTTDTDATLFDPGYHTFESGEIGLDTIGDVTRVLVTHGHHDHLDPDFVRWLRDRRADLTIYSNDWVAELLAPEGIPVETTPPSDVMAEDVTHGMLPNGSQPPNRSFTIEGVFTHPGDSREPTSSAPVLALPLLVPWGSTREAVEFAMRLKPTQVVPIHDHYMSAGGRARIRGMVGAVLAEYDIELVDVDWGESFSV